MNLHRLIASNPQHVELPQTVSFRLPKKVGCSLLRLKEEFPTKRQILRVILSASLMVSSTHILNACTHTLTIKTEPPGAQVRLLSAQGDKNQILGTTPLETSALSGLSAAVLDLELRGHLPKQVLIYADGSTNLNISTTLQPLSQDFLASTSRREFAQALNSNLAEILKLQALILAKKNAEVAAQEKSMAEKWEDVSLFHSLMGNYHYLNGDLSKALAKYQKAVSIDPANEEALIMIETLRGKK